ncbi:hypothetical protein [Alteromonas lipotrueiana]|uniref:hypothetical protein n=1 Tax=Alteromonas lipotrueiana TaxID=2803815 RepID=UPI001C4541C0|nr:hypothetical protein [Alteromonas lipotrueiana]
MRLSILVFAVFLAACTTTTTLDLNKMEQAEETKTTFYISVEDGPSSELVKEVGSTFCNTSFVTVIESVNTTSEWNKLVKVTFENSKSKENLAILFYLEETNGTLIPLVKHSADDFAEPLGMEFSLGEKIASMVYLQSNDFGISLEPARKIDSLLSQSNGATRTEEFEFSILELDFVPDLIKFKGISVNAVFDNIRVNHDRSQST